METYNQKTIKHEISCVGIGLHTGNKVSLSLKPAEIDSGIIFHRTDINGKDSYIKAIHDNVIDTRLCTCIGNKNGIKIMTIEHLMAAIHSFGITNLLIELNGSETPILDGSSSQFIFLLECAGIKTQNASAKAIKILKPVIFKNNEKEVGFFPAEKNLNMKFSIDFPNTIIGHQEANLILSQSNFKNMFSRARTFGFLHDIEMLRSAGLARGGSLENAILVNDNTIMNKDGLRYSNEFVRHKMLDAVGDIYMSGYTIIGNFIGNKSGHADTHQLLTTLFSDNSNFEIVDMNLYYQSIENKKDSFFLQCA